VNVPVDNELSLHEIRDKLMGELDSNDVTEESSSQISKVIDNLQEREDELNELNDLKTSMDKSKSPKVYNRLLANISECQDAISKLKFQLNNENTVNEYINSNYSSSQYDYLQSNSTKL
jgi:hypothetical protein